MAGGAESGCGLAIRLTTEPVIADDADDDADDASGRIAERRSAMASLSARSWSMCSGATGLGKYCAPG